MPESPFIRVRRRWRRLGAMMPMHIPAEGHDVLRLLELGEIERFSDELCRLSSLGSPWASALLAWLCLIPAKDGVRDVNRAIDLCRRHAYAGDSYSRYVLAWALVYAGHKEDALPMMARAAEAGFPPASVDLITLLWGNLRERPKLAVELLSRADRSRHMAAMLWRCRVYQTGSLGFARRILGYLMMPIALWRGFWGFWKDPFSCEALLFQEWMTKPALLEGDMSEQTNSKPNIDPDVAFDKKALLVAYVIFALCSVLTFLDHVDLGWAASPGYTSGTAVLMIAVPALIPYMLSWLAARQLMATQWLRLLKYRRLRLYLLLLVLAVGTLFSSLLMAGTFDVLLTRLMMLGLFVAETLAYLGAVGLFLSDEWRST